MSRWGERWSGSVAGMSLSLFGGRVDSNEAKAEKIARRMRPWLHTKESRTALLRALYGVRVQQSPDSSEENSAAIEQLDAVVRVAEVADVHRRMGLLLDRAVSVELERDLLARIVKEYGNMLSQALLTGKDDNRGGESYRLYLMLLKELPENEGLSKVVFSKLKYALVEREFALATSGASAAEVRSPVEGAKPISFNDHEAPAQTVALLAGWLGQEENKVRLSAIFQQVSEEYQGRASRIFVSAGRTSELRAVAELSRENPFPAMRTLWSEPDSSWTPAGKLSNASLNLTLMQEVERAFFADMKERLAHDKVPVEQVALVFATVELKKRYLPEGKALFLQIERCLVRQRDEPLADEAAGEAAASKGGMKLE